MSRDDSFSTQSATFWQSKIPARQDVEQFEIEVGRFEGLGIRLDGQRDAAGAVVKDR